MNSAWFSLQLELDGRVNFGEGVLWLAGYELGNIRLPDPRYLPDGQLTDLVEAIDILLDRPVQSIFEELHDPAWLALNAIVFEILGFSATEGEAIVEAVQERVSSRLLKAGKSRSRLLKAGKSRSRLLKAGKGRTTGTKVEEN